MKQLLKSAVVAYCAYKIVDAMTDKKENKVEEYIPFDELEVKEEPKMDENKKAALFVGGIAVGFAIMPKTIVFIAEK